MSDYNRGAYTPPSQDAPLAFDARRPVRGSSPAPVTLILSGIVLVVLIAGAWFLYKDGFKTDGAPQKVGQVAEAPKEAPKADEQPKDDAGELQIYTQEDGAPPPAEGYAAAPEQPLPRPPPEVVQAKPAAPVEKADLRPLENTPPKAVEKAPPPKVDAKAPAPKPAAGGKFLVQIGAFSTPALADKGWSDAAALAPAAAAGKGKRVEAVESNGKTLYRTSVTGFGAKADADAFCAKLKAAGKTCFVR